MEGDPFALIESMTIAGYVTGAHVGYLYIRGEYPLATRRLDRRDRRRPRPRLPRRGRDGRGLRLRHRAAPRRRGLHLRRGDRAPRVDRGVPRRAAQQAAVPQRVGAVRQADGDQQRRDALQRPRGPEHRRAVVRRGRRRTLHRLEAVLPVRGGRRAGRLRGRLRHHAAPAARPRRRRPGRPAHDPARRGGRRVRHARGPRRRPHPRGRARHRRDARVGRRPRLRQPRRPHRHAAAHRGVLPRRVVRPVRALPRRHRAPGGGPGPSGAGRADRLAGDRDGAARGPGPCHARRLDLRPRPDRPRGDHVGAAARAARPAGTGTGRSRNGKVPTP